MDYDYDDLADEFDPEDYGLEQPNYEFVEEAKGSHALHAPFHEIVNHCLIPTVGEASAHLGKLLFYCLIFRLVVNYGPAKLKNITSVACGVMISYHFFGPLTWYLAAHAVLSYLTLQLTHLILARWRGAVTAIVSVSFLIACELFLVLAVEWHSIRGAQMLIAMKAISVGFDRDTDTMKAIPMPLDYFGYIFCVGTIIFGPWTKYSDYVRIGEEEANILTHVLGVSTTSTVSLIFLSMSTCWGMWLFPNGSNKWLIAYRDALSFRSSHYFVSKMAEASTLTCDLQRRPDPATSKKSDSSQASASPIVVCNPLKIEFPRSLVEVVVFWNLPMHYWLRTYVFKNTRHLGSFAAILCTYAASALLHGLNFQLAAVLLSLGFYTYTEHVLRSKLANMTDTCIEARACVKCDHKYKESHFAVKIVNFLFTLLAIFHLIYLGFMFNHAGSTEEEGYNIHHTLAKWWWLNYSSHWVVLVCFIIASVL